MIARDDRVAAFEAEFPMPTTHGKSHPALRGWAARIRSWMEGIDGHSPAPRDAWRAFLADRVVDDELVDLSDTHSGLADRISERVSQCTRHFEELERNPKDRGAPSFDLCHAMRLLWQRIDKALEIVDRAPAVQSGTKPPDSETTEVSDLVTLSQVAPLVGLSKRTLETHLQAGRLPRPDIQGGKGRSSKWYWHAIRPELAKFGNKALPKQFPGSAFVAQT